MNFIKNLMKKYLLSGIIILSPILITIWIFTALTLTLDRLFKPLMNLVLPRTFVLTMQEKIPFEIHGYGIILTFFVIIITGIIGRNFLGQYFLNLSETLLHRLPIIPKVYNSIKQIIGTFIREEKEGYSGVALVEYPRKGLYTLALITGTPDPLFTENINEDKLVSLYVPTTPNPTSGFYLVTKEKDIKRLDISVEHAFKIILSCGIIQNKTQVISKENVTS